MANKFRGVILIAGVSWLCGCATSGTLAPVTIEEPLDEVALVRVNSALTVVAVDDHAAVQQPRTPDEIQTLRLSPGTHMVRVRYNTTYVSSNSSIHEYSKEFPVSLAVRAGHRYLLSCSTGNSLVLPFVVDESEQESPRHTVPGNAVNADSRTISDASRPMPMRSSFVIAGVTFDVTGGDVQQLYASRELLVRALKGLHLTRQPDRVEFLSRYAKERQSHPELVNVVIFAEIEGF